MNSEANNIKLIVISSPVGRENEIEDINALFEAGLKRFHLRKPLWDKERLMSFTNRIDKKWHSLIAVHVKKDETKWPEWIGTWHGPGQASRSIHTWEEYLDLDKTSAYCLIGPLFDSISKEGYRANPDLRKTTLKSGVQKVAIGGINHENAHQAFEWGYDGVALLGSIWNENDPTDNFLLAERSIEPALL